MTHRTCDVPECDRSHLAKGYCAMHYQRVAAHGDPNGTKPRNRQRSGTCTIEGCGRAHKALGYCESHYMRVYRKGDAGSSKAERRVRKPCEFEGCGSIAVAYGLCHGHRQQAQKGQPLRPVRKFSDPRVRDDRGRKQCRECGDWKKESEFYGHKSGLDGLSGHCRRCHRDKRLRNHFGITIDQYEEMLEAQGGACAICQGQSQREGRSFDVDHDHSCCPGTKSCGACLRGLLCEDCNRAIGLMRDAPKRLEAAAAYVRRFARV